jgi:alpha-tubulin suppressor-like RCC1 family protein
MLSRIRQISPGQTSQRARRGERSSARRAWLAPLLLASLALLFACLKGRSPTDAGANDVRFDLHAQVSGGGSTLHVTVTYLAQGANPEQVVQIQLLDQRITVATGTQSLPLTIDLTRCLADPKHIASAGSSCDLVAVIALEQNGTVVDSVTVGPVTVTPGQVVHESTSLTPIGHIDLYPPVDTVAVGAVVQLLDTVFSPTNAILTNVSVTWKSADTSIATVDSTDGDVTGVKAGTTTITVSAGGQQAQATITVLPVSSGGITVGRFATFQASQNGTVPLPAYLLVTSTDTTKTIGNLVATITPSSATAWLIANVSDTNYGGARVVKRPRVTGLKTAIRRQTSGSGVVTPAYLDVHPTTTALTPGSYTATVNITGTGGASAAVAITYTVSAPSNNLVFSPNPVTFDQYAYGRTLASAQTTTASVSGGGTLGTLSQTGSIGYSGADANWLSSVTINGATATLAPNTTSLSIGSDTATVPFSATGGTGSLTVIVNTWVTYTKIVTGQAFGCGLTTAETVYCWGDNAYGQIGNGASPSTLPAALVPTRVLLPTSPGNGVIDIAAGGYHACAILQSNAVYCWGENNQGQLGIGTSDGNPHPTPAQIPSATYSQIAAGSYHTCGIEGTGGTNYLDCWGDNTFGELAIGTTDGSPHPTPTNTGNIYLSGYVSAGGGHTCAIGGSGGLYCWGDNSAGAIGVGVTGGTYATPQFITVNPTGLGTSLVSAGNNNTCAIDAQAYAYCWGDNVDGQLGNGSTAAANAPVRVPGLQFTQISSGALQTCGLALGGVPYCWGNNSLGSLGNGTTGGNLPSPTAVVISGSASEIVSSLGGQFACYLVSGSNGVYCYGYNLQGDLGVGVSSLAPGGDTGTPLPIFGQPAPSGVGPSRVVKGPRRVRK